MSVADKVQMVYGRIEALCSNRLGDTGRATSRVASSTAADGRTTIMCVFGRKRHRQADPPFLRIGRSRSGEHSGEFIGVYAHQGAYGWHIAIQQHDPRLGPSEGWDMWADTWEDVETWVGPDNLDVEWFDVDEFGEGEQPSR